jgi:hypothetical protein
MKTIKIKVYQFSELSEDAKQKAIENLSDINVDPDWWDCTYEDAETIGLEITEFDLGRNRHCKGEFINDSEDVAKKIIAKHGESCETYKMATKFLAKILRIKKRKNDWPEDQRDDFVDSCDYVDQMEDANAEFLQSILEDYSIMLQKEYEYLTSEEAIIETIEANEYDFIENGERY